MTSQEGEDGSGTADILALYFCGRKLHRSGSESLPVCLQVEAAVNSEVTAAHSHTGQQRAAQEAAKKF